MDETEIERPLWRRLLPWVLPPVLVLVMIALLLLWFEAAPPVPFHYTSP